MAAKALVAKAAPVIRVAAQATAAVMAKRAVAAMAVAASTEAAGTKAAIRAVAAVIRAVAAAVATRPVVAAVAGRVGDWADEAAVGAAKARLTASAAVNNQLVNSPYRYVGLTRPRVSATRHIEIRTQAP